ncbi:MAG: MBOAT family protein [Planctomycetes bacterium]|nr:MBOAT family protein [Planctomycetota bacterium]
MIFSEPRFLTFFVLVFAAHWILRWNTARKWLLLGASLYFYGCWDVRFLALIVACGTVDWLVGLGLGRAHARGRNGFGWIVLSIVYNLGTLGFFKYFNFFTESGAELLRWLGLPVGDVTLSIVLPVGISFFTFQAMSYTIDVYRRQLEPVRSYPDFLLFVAFFPQLVAGPIVRAATFLPQLPVKRSWATVDVHGSLALFLSGFVKKAVVADLIAQPVDTVFAAPSEYGALSLVAATCGFAVQVYCDFSGYSDMAIGSARLLGYELCENFRFPFFARDITDLWRRWHMSLSTWLRDYVYFTLGGNRGSLWFTYRNVMLTMLLGGLWHGAAWNFVVWGAIHGVALVVHREWVRRFGAGRLRLLAGPLTLYAFLLALGVFRAPSLGDGWLTVRAWLCGASPGERGVTLHPMLAGLPLPLQCAIVFGGLLGLHWLAYRGAGPWLRQRLPGWLLTLLFGAISAIALSFVPQQARPFVYFQF